MLVNKKDIIRINQEIGCSGELQNRNSLEFAMDIIKSKKSWLYELSYIVRSLLTDHAFQDGNKRTSLALILAYFEYYGKEPDKQLLIYNVFKIAKKNIKDINKIMRNIKNGIIY